MSTGTVAAIHLIAEQGGPPAPVESVRAVPGLGLQGDRYVQSAVAAGKKVAPTAHVTLIEGEALKALKRDYGIGLAPGESRRNITTRGVALNHLIGRRFRVGEATLRGHKLCEPCGYLEGKTRPGVRAGLVHRGGLRAEILTGGVIRVGDEILPL